MQLTRLYRPRTPMSGTERTMEPMVAPAVLCTRVLRVSKGYIMRVVVPDAIPPANAARTSSFPVLSFCAGGPVQASLVTRAIKFKLQCAGPVHHC